MNKKIFKKILWIYLFIIIFIIIAMPITLIFMQSSILFHPWHDEKSYTQLQNLDDSIFEELSIDNNGKKLSGWFKHNIDDPKGPLVIFMGGNAQNSSNTCFNFLNANIYKYFDGYNLMIVDYPGYGLSEGITSEETMFDAALKMYDYATTLDCVDTDNIVVLGYSIGTGVATYLASQRNVNGLILIAPYDEILSLYNNKINIFHGPLKSLAKYKFDSKYYAQSINVSPLIISSYDDEIISYKFSQNLAKYFKNTEKILMLDNNVKHNYYFLQEDVLTSISEYLKNRL